MVRRRLLVVNCSTSVSFLRRIIIGSDNVQRVCRTLQTNFSQKKNYEEGKKKEISVHNFIGTSETDRGFEKKNLIENQNPRNVRFPSPKKKMYYQLTMGPIFEATNIREPACPTRTPSIKPWPKYTAWTDERGDEFIVEKKTENYERVRSPLR